MVHFHALIAITLGLIFNMINLLKVNRVQAQQKQNVLLVQVLIIEPLIHRLENVRAMTNILMINWIMLYVQTATIHGFIIY